MASEWEDIGSLGMVGMETDLVSVSRDPRSLDLAVNVREEAEELGNAGGYTAIANGDFPP